MRLRVRVLVLIALAASLGCGRPTNEVLVQGPIFGTSYLVRAIAAEPDRELIETLIRTELDAVDRATSTYREDSELSRFNRLPAGGALRFSKPTWQLLELAWRVQTETGGAFDPTVGPLVDAWGFGPPGRGLEPEPPDPDRLTALRRALGGIELLPSERRVRKLEDAAALDLSAIAKGWAIDRVSKALLAAGHKNHLVEVGGELRGEGRNSNGESWRIGIERPPRARAWPAGREPRAGLQRVLPISGRAVATSGNYRNYWERDGVRYSHTIDPRTGRPVEHDLASASVIHVSGTLADAYATALMVMGAEEGLRWADSHGIAAVLLRHEAAGIREETSTAFEHRFHGSAETAGRHPNEEIVGSRE